MAFGLVLWAGLLIGDQPATRAGEPDDDLAVVKRAVAQTATTPAPSLPAIQDDERPRARSGAKPQWLRVRVTENNGKRVRINVPLSLVRAVGDWPIDLCRDWDPRPLGARSAALQAAPLGSARRVGRRSEPGGSGRGRRREGPDLDRVASHRPAT
jgi:hypothetical protein